jgi:hypothetical protein
VFTARYASSSYIKLTHLVFKGLNDEYFLSVWGAVLPQGLCTMELASYLVANLLNVGRYTVFVIAIRYRLDGPGIESR